MRQLLPPDRRHREHIELGVQVMSLAELTLTAMAKARGVNWCGKLRNRIPEYN